MKINSSFAEGFLDGLGAGLFTRLRRPGAPDKPIDSRPLDEYFQSDDFRETLARFGKQVPTEAAATLAQPGTTTATPLDMLVHDDAWNWRYAEDPGYGPRRELSELREAMILLLFRLDAQIDKTVREIDHIDEIKNDPAALTALRSNLLEMKQQLTYIREHA